MQDVYKRQVLIPQAVSPGSLCLVQNRAVDQRGHNNNFALRLYGFDLTNGSQAVLEMCIRDSSCSVFLLIHFAQKDSVLYIYARDFGLLIIDK